MPLPDALLRAGELERPEPRYPLDVAFCPSCSLVQILAEVPREQLFVDNYLYFSSFSDGLMRHSREHARQLIEQRALGEDSLVVEIASNDGYLLRNFADAGIPVLGIDPAPAQAAAAEAVGVPTLAEFFDADLARRLVGEGRRADVIVANNVMAHTPTLNSFVEGLRILLADDGVATIENTYVKDLIDHREFDTIYHEHLSYFSVTALDRLFAAHGLAVVDVERMAIHGGSLRVTVAHAGTPRSRVVEALLEEEEGLGLTKLPFYTRFGRAVEDLRTQLTGLLAELRAHGHRIAAYGAAAKGSTLLNYCGVDCRTIEFVADRNPHKQGKLMPGAGIPVVSPHFLRATRPDYVLLLTWNFADEILAQQAAFREAGGRFIIPIPDVRVV
jgi:SAM-dependent methyltransferase